MLFAEYKPLFQSCCSPCGADFVRHSSSCFPGELGWRRRNVCVWRLRLCPGKPYRHIQAEAPRKCLGEQPHLITPYTCNKTLRRTCYMLLQAIPSDKRRKSQNRKCYMHWLMYMIRRSALDCSESQLVSAVCPIHVYAACINCLFSFAVCYGSFQ